MTALGIVGGILAVGMWMSRGGGSRDCARGTCDILPRSRKIIDDTNFVTAWVVFGFVGYELLVAASGEDLGAAVCVAYGAYAPGW